EFKKITSVSNQPHSGVEPTANRTSPVRFGSKATFRIAIVMSALPRYGHKLTFRIRYVTSISYLLPFFCSIWTRHSAIAFAGVGNAPDGAARITRSQVLSS